MYFELFFKSENFHHDFFLHSTMHSVPLHTFTADNPRIYHIAEHLFYRTGKKEIEKNGKRKKTLNFKSKVCQKLFLKLKKETLINFYAYLNTLTKYLSTTVQLLTHANKEINLYLKPFEYSSVCFQSHFQRCKNSWKSKL